jgi:predicted deacetylase
MTRVQALWGLCRAHGVVPGLLVVPDWHGRAPVEADADFGEWVRERASEGAEIFLHGERHDEVGLPRRWRDEIRALGRTAREGEFLSLDYAAARDRIDRGLERLRTVGLEPVGFVPPAWLGRPETHLAAKDAGLAVSEDDARVFVHARGLTVESPVLRWSARGALRAHASVLQERMRWALQREATVMRVALHPSDLDHRAVAASIERAMSAWLAIRAPAHYSSLWS